MSTSAQTHWTCQCGVQVPMGCSHSCGHIGAPPIQPYPEDKQAVIDSLWAQRDALEKRLADIEADWCVALINGTESDTDVINRVCKLYLAFRDGTKVNELRRKERPEAHA